MIAPSNPYGVKPGQVWADTKEGRGEAVVVSLQTATADVQWLGSGIVFRRRLERFSRTYNFRLVREGEPLPVRTVKPSQAAPYLTYIPDRSPNNKVHESLGQAKKAITFRASHREGLPGTSTIYQWVDNHGWETLHEIPSGTKKEDLPWR